MDDPTSPEPPQQAEGLDTKILAVDSAKLGWFKVHNDSTTYGSTYPRQTGHGYHIEEGGPLPLTDWDIELDSDSPDARHLELAAQKLRHLNIPVAFPTETVYGLGADATRSEAVRGIYAAKRRPADNPLIVHIASIRQLRELLRSNVVEHGGPESPVEEEDDPIPAIYKPLIRRFWPGPLTIILPKPSATRLAREVTAGLSTFGARMPRNLLALALIRLANVPIAAPSANASTRPSPTAAEHVMDDLQGRIELILDAGPCDVGVESTVVDGLCDPPCILRPGGVSLDQIRNVEGWERTVKAYKDEAAKSGEQPRAPGMKYRHYSPRARVMLFEAGRNMPEGQEMAELAGQRRRLGLVRTKRWHMLGAQAANGTHIAETEPKATSHRHAKIESLSMPYRLPADSPIKQMLEELSDYQSTMPKKRSIQTHGSDETTEIWDMQIGPETKDIARGLFSALRDLDKKDVDCILVEGIDDSEGDVAAAVMNRLRKAAEITIAA